MKIIEHLQGQRIMMDALAYDERPKSKMHLRRIDERKTTCGKAASWTQDTTNAVSLVTCKRCLALAGKGGGK